MATTKPDGPAVSGTVVSVGGDSFGDTGTLSIQPATGSVLTFKVTNATTIDATIGGKLAIHTLEGVKKGQTVSITSAKGSALHIDITADPNKKK